MELHFLFFHEYIDITSAYFRIFLSIILQQFIIASLDISNMQKRNKKRFYTYKTYTTI